MVTVLLGDICNLLKILDNIFYFLNSSCRDDLKQKDRNQTNLKTFYINLVEVK